MMITLPEHVSHDDGWNSTGKPDKLDHLESAMDWAEHQFLVASGRHLIANFSEKASGWNHEREDERRAILTFKALKSAYCETGPIKLRVSKGIHQPTKDPHIQLAIYGPHNIPIKGPPKVHLDLSAEWEFGESFCWEANCFRCEIFKRIFRWPQQRQRRRLKGQRQRLASSTDHAGLNDAIAEHQAREAEEKERQEAARAESDRMKRRAEEAKKAREDATANSNAGREQSVEFTKRFHQFLEAKRLELVHKKGANKKVKLLSGVKCRPRGSGTPRRKGKIPTCQVWYENGQFKTDELK